MLGVWICCKVGKYTVPVRSGSRDGVLAAHGDPSSEDTSFGTDRLVRKMCLQAVRQQFAKVTRLVQLDQYTSARQQLREGVAALLRDDLRDAQESYANLTDQVRSSIRSALVSTSELVHVRAGD